ncbi:MULTISPECIES: collagen-like protein [unclassified Pseudomonas]|uniref:collagen-like protein n=1 Tax=unclassified Pseudomonas TaxID=196821 RepID=UPI00244C1F09|nr:collagen-like protein [Pseudomonas sp. GD03944]MDH1264656.1 collagen-like protein [Pseudomonas sp. GD03944]
MRKAILLAALLSPLAMAQTVVDVNSHTMLRLPTTSSVLVLERLQIADHGTLLVPAGLTEIRITELRLGRDARIAIAPSEQTLHLNVVQGDIAEGAQITARGAPGTHEKAALPGRTLNIRLEKVVTQTLLIDARGGAGVPGFHGLDGADGKPGGCAWGDASRGHDGLDGADGQTGAAGGKVRLEVPQDFPIERMQVRVEGGEGGPAGKGGKPGAGGASTGCWLYSTDGARDGRPGQPGLVGGQGAHGSVDIVRF